MSLSRMTLSLIIVSCSFYGRAVEHKINGDALIRYESDSDHIIRDEQQRIRFSGHLGLTTNWSNSWKTQFRISTGLKDRQNIPSITLHRFSAGEKRSPEIFIDRIAATYKNNNYSIMLGKIPWQLKENTAQFWDTDLNPYGVFGQIKVSNDHQFSAGIYQPLDGEWNNIGLLSVFHWQYKTQLTHGILTLTPWLVDYQGESGAQHATHDTELDNRSVRLGIGYQINNIKIGLDYGHSLSNFDKFNEYKDQKDAWSAIIKHGNIKNKGALETQLLLFYIERFGAINEFAQSSRSRFASVNYKLVEVRMRKALSSEWWCGIRFGYSETLLGDKEQGKRLRFETQMKF